jgi:hypothetical protein
MMHPAQLYYSIALQRGYRSQRSVNRREAAYMGQLYEKNPAEFDRAWDRLASGLL